MIALTIPTNTTITFKNLTKVVQLIIPTLPEAVKVIFDDVDTYIDANGVSFATTLTFPLVSFAGSQTIPLVVPFEKWVSKVTNPNADGQFIICIEESDFV
jgi:hypothetical protein